jgi:predicted SAM-dependent methyltransferase
MNRLNLGCQVHYFDGWINQDIVSDDPNIRTDLNGDARSLPYGDNTIDFIYAGHLIEHFYPDTVGSAIKEWHRVLKPGGQLVIVTPNCGIYFRRYVQGQLSMEHLLQQVYGRINAYDVPGKRHHLIFDELYLRKVVHENGVRWVNDQDLNFNHPPEELVPFMDTHINRGYMHSQLGIILTK